MLSHQPQGFSAHRRHIQETKAGAQLAPHEDIAPQALLIGECFFLVDRLHAQRTRFAHGQMIDALPTKIDFAAWVWLMITGDDLDQCRLAGAVVAQETDNLAGPDLKIDVFE
jgi:hypothetical protein